MNATPGKVDIRDRQPESLVGRWLALISGPGFFRLTLAILVFASHVSRFEVGRPAVMIFFMLSGYWVVRLYDEGDLSIASFEINRFLRVWPLFAIVAVLAVVVDHLLGLPPKGTLLSTLPLLGLASRGGDLLGISWSLDIEMEFYLLIPFVLIGFSRLKSRLRPVDVICLLSLFFIVGVILLQRGIATVAVYSPMFAVGAYIYLGGWKASRHSALLSLALFVAFGLMLAIVPEFTQLLTKERSDWWRDIVHMIWCLTLAPFVSFNVHQKSGPLDRHLGNLSYPFYLVHTTMIAVGLTLFRDSVGSAKLFALAATIIASLLLYAAVDRPMESLRRKLAPGNRPAK